MRQLAASAFERIADLPLDLAVVIPVLNERDNVTPLLEKLSITLAGVEWEAIFVDDGSRDGTAELVAEIGACDRRVRLIRRIGRRGLSSAVVEGMLSTLAPVVAVMDGDLQHDERIVLKMYELLRGGACELAVGTRYAEGGHADGLSGFRFRISRTATLFAGLVAKTKLSDPMSGLFAMRRDLILEVAPRLSTVGYKILLDIVASSPRALQTQEIVYTFRLRHAGESKFDAAIALEYIELILEKTIGRWVPPRFALFSAIGTLGLLVHLTVLGLLLKAAGADFIFAQTIAVIAAMTFNYALNNLLTYRDRRLKGVSWWRGLLSFAAICSVGATANIGIAEFVFSTYSGDWLLAGVSGAVVAALWNFVVTERITWAKR